jgi:hypothetical protein
MSGYINSEMIKEMWRDRKALRGCNCTDINPSVCEFVEIIAYHPVRLSTDCTCQCHDFETEVKSDERK